MICARAFSKLGIDFIGPIHPRTPCTHAQYIIVAMHYVTKWVEAKAMQKNNAHIMAKLLFECAIMRYSLPIEIVSNQEIHFLNEIIEHRLQDFMVNHNRKSAPYHSQENGHTKKILITVLTKILRGLKIDCEMKLHSALWAYKVAYKMAIGTTPFNMVYGLDAILPMEFWIPTLHVSKELAWTMSCQIGLKS